MVIKEKITDLHILLAFSETNTTPDISSNIVEFFNSLHCNLTVIATNTSQVIKTIQSQPFDLVFIVQSVADLNPLTVLKALKSLPIEPPHIIVINESDDLLIAEKSINSGALECIPTHELTHNRLHRVCLISQEKSRANNTLISYQEKLKNLSEIDALTGLVNRYMFDIILKKALSLAKRQNKKIAVLLMDLDKFKNVNDSLGHDIGDELLKEVAHRLNTSIRNDDIACRLGGDEFIILLQNLDNHVTPSSLAHRIFHKLLKPCQVFDHSISISGSIGIATFPECATDANQLLKCADIAMYRAKEAGRNQVHFYSKKIHHDVQRRIELEKDIRSAMQNNELVIHYQPQLGAQSQKLVSAEALVRWQHPTKGLLAPLEFIPIAEDMGMMEEVGLWIFSNACKQLAQWRKQYNNKPLNLSIAINLSSLQLNNDHLFKEFEEVLTSNYLPANHIELELTEHVINKTDSAKSLLNKLSDLGVKLALAGFGTGYSSLSQLQSTRFDVIKIDRTFIKKMTAPENDFTFLKAINSFAKIMNCRVVAEGIETPHQHNICCELAFDRLQGIYYSKALPAHEFEAQWLKLKD